MKWSDLQLELVSKHEAAEWFAKYHYTGTVGGCWFFKAMDGGQPLAMVALGKGANRFGVAEKFELTEWHGNLEITRVACHPQAPFNTASRCLSAVCQVLAIEGTHWVFSYSDTAQGHHGGIYQAVNAIFVGTDAKQWVNFELDGKRVSKRMVSGKFGHTRWPEVAQVAERMGHLLRRVEWKPKLTYILPVARDARIRKKIREALQLRELPYPKRTEELCDMATPYRNHRPLLKQSNQTLAAPSVPK